MGSDGDKKPDNSGHKDEVNFKWEELKIRIEHNKYYLTIALQANAFFYATTGVVLGFYLKEPDCQAGQAAVNHLEFILLLPILIGAVLGGIFIYGAGLQELGARSLDDLVTDLKNKNVVIKPIYDNYLLRSLLKIFGYIFFLVAALLIAVPFLTRTPSLLELHNSGRWDWDWSQIFFLFLALFVLALAGWRTWQSTRKPNKATGRNSLARRMLSPNYLLRWIGFFNSRREGTHMGRRRRIRPPRSRRARR